MFLSAVAQRTQRLLLGPLVYLLPVHHPLRLAEEICMLDHLSRGRFQLGIGRGASPHELSFLGAAPEDAQAMYEEALLILRKALSADRLHHYGRFWQFTDVPIEMRPLQQPHPPLWYAVSGPDSVGWPAANGVNVVCAGPPGRVRETTDAYRAAARATGQVLPPERCLGMMRFIVVGRTDGDAMAVGRRAWPAFHRHFWQLWRARGSQPKTLRLPDTFDALVESGAAVAGSPATVFDVLADQVETAGVDYLIGSFVFGDMEYAQAVTSLERFTDEVMPRFGIGVGQAA